MVNHLNNYSHFTYNRFFKKKNLYPLNFVFIFNLRIITLQYCDDFCHTSVWISHSFTYVPSLLNLPPSPSHPSRLSQSPGFGFPVSCSKFPLAICFAYGNIYVSVRLSQIIPPSPSPTVSKILLYVFEKRHYSFSFGSAGAFFSFGEQGLLFASGRRLLIAVASLITERRL